MEKKSLENSIGETIRKMRIGRKMNIEDVVKCTYVSEMFIFNLENNQFERLPAKVYALSLAEDIMDGLRVEDDTKHDILTRLEEELNRVEHAKYNILKEENYTSKVSKFSIEEEKNIKGQAEIVAAAASSSRKAVPVYKSTTATKVLASTVAKELENGEDEILEERFLRQRLLWWSITVILALALSTVLVWFLFFRSQGILVSDFEKDIKKQNFQVFALYGRSQTFEMTKGDQLRIFLANTIVILSLIELNETELTLRDTRGVLYRATLHERQVMDLYRENQIGDVLVKYQKTSGELAVIFVENLLYNDVQVDYDKIWYNQEHVLVDRAHTLLEAQVKTPITVYVKALTLPIHLSYNVDGRRQNTFNLSIGASVVITADEHLELQIGNYLSSALIVNKIPINLYLEAYSRYSTTKIIKWLASYDNETIYDLVITDYLN